MFRSACRAPWSLGRKRTLQASRVARLTAAAARNACVSLLSREAAHDALGGAAGGSDPAHNGTLARSSTAAQAARMRAGTPPSIILSLIVKLSPSAGRIPSAVLRTPPLRALPRTADAMNGHPRYSGYRRSAAPIRIIHDCGGGSPPVILQRARPSSRYGTYLETAGSTKADTASNR
jgi:hypothetical protein